VGRDDVGPDFGSAYPPGAEPTAGSRFAVFPLFFQRKRSPLPRATSRSGPHAAQAGRDDARPDFGRAHPQRASLTAASRFAVFPLFFQRKRGPLPRAASRSERHAAEVGRDDARPDFGRAHPQGAGLTAESRFAVFPLFFQRKCGPLPRAASRSEPHAAADAGRLRPLYFPVNFYVDRLRRCHDRRDQHALPIRFLAAPFTHALVQPFHLGPKLPFRCFPL